MLLLKNNIFRGSIIAIPSSLIFFTNGCSMRSKYGMYRQNVQDQIHTEGVNLNAHQQEDIENVNDRLCEAIISQRIDEIPYWIALSPNINTFNDSGTTPLHCAVDSGNVNIVNLILSVRDVNTEAIDERGYTPLMLAVLFDYNNNNLEIVNALLEHGADINATCPINGQTALHIACCTRELAYNITVPFPKDIIQKLIDSGAQIMKDNLGHSPLYYLYRDYVYKDNPHRNRNKRDKLKVVRSLIDLGQIQNKFYEISSDPGTNCCYREFTGCSKSEDYYCYIDSGTGGTHRIHSMCLSCVYNCKCEKKVGGFKIGFYDPGHCPVCNTLNREFIDGPRIGDFEDWMREF